MKRQRVLFLKENYVLRVFKNFMFAGLYLIALLLILVHKVDLGLIAGISQSVFYITAPLIHIVQLPSEAVGKGYKKISELINIYEENERLKKENDQLFLLKDRMKAIKAENTLLKELLHHFDTPKTPSYTARVIAENGNAFSNALTLYLGDNAQHVKTGYAVVCKSGLIGRIDLVSGKYARVSLITDINSKIPVITQKSRDRGILIGNNSPELKLIFTPLLAELHKGDMLVTSGVGGGLPPDIPVARISKAGVENTFATPLFSTSQLEIVKIIAYDVMPDLEQTKELE